MKKLLQDLSIAIKGTEKNFTTGSIRRALFLLSIPMILEMVMESLFAVVDAFWVSKVGVEAVATVGLTESVMFLIYAISIGLSMGTTAMVARRYGEGKLKEAADTAVQAILIGVVLSIPICLSGIFFAEDILRLMGGSETLIAEGSGYTQIMLAGNFSIMLIFLINAIFRGAGDASIAMRSLVLANTLNIILDPCFIFGWGPFPEMGVQGAAVATTLGRSIGVMYQIGVFTKGKALIRIAWTQIRVQWELIMRLFKLSLGGMAQYLIGSASWVFLVRIISEFGSEALAGYTIAVRIILFTILPSWGLANAAATLVGQNLGAQQPERAERSVWMSSFYNMLFLLGISIIFLIWAPDFIAIFRADEAVIHYGTLSLRIICAGYLFYAYGMVISQSFNGAGDTRTPTLINLVCFWLIQIPVAYVFAITLEWGPSGVFTAIALSEAILAIICIYIFRIGKWKEVVV